MGPLQRDTTNGALAQPKKDAIFITGGAGYVASNLAKALLDGPGVHSECKLILFDIVSPSRDCDLLYQPGYDVTFVRGDLSKEEDVVQVITRFSLHYNILAVFHVAGYGLCGDSNLPAYDAITEAVNFKGTQHVVSACISNNIKYLGKYLLKVFAAALFITDFSIPSFHQHCKRSFQRRRGVGRKRGNAQMGQTRHTFGPVFQKQRKRRTSRY